MKSLRIRLPLIAAAILASSLALAVLLAYQLLSLVGQRDLDQALQRELNRFTLALTEYSEEHREPDGVISAETLRNAVNDYYRLNPGSDTYLTVIRLGNSVFVSPAPPAQLTDLSDRLAIPPNAGTGFETLDSQAGTLRAVQAPITVNGETAGSAQVVGALDPISDQTSQSLVWLGIVAAISLVTGGTALSIVITRTLAPLRDLAATAQQTGQLHDLDARVPQPARRDEIGILAEEFNRMLDRLQGAAQAQTDFMARVSHELRTPITIARGHTETLEYSPTTDPRRIQHTAAIVREEIDRIAGLVEDLFALARADQPNFIAPEPVALPQFFRDLTTRAAGLQLTGVNILPPPGVTINADPTRLSQAILNLLRNAAIHTPDGTIITLTAHADAHDVQFIVTDDGPGIPSALLRDITEPYVRGPRPPHHDSTGLGLAVVNEIARAHHGELRITSTPSGTTATISLPRRATPASPA
ncbi:HAMP domain-containing sensor histidine kinase [Hoyosella altamirensis]|uniref:histidine kinase n=1 Tax=Hoyosella altamirensis TaxID=616997 RepID=A0A839RVL8_9ACTN|nr:ATP-binding protein [Hoyosella altamirensis]MBB3040064.1 signal transduction histidine kinase [Hoyosella altamirensis]